MSDSIEELATKLEALSIDSTLDGCIREGDLLRAAALKLRELRMALEPFAISSKRDWDDDAEDETEIWSSQGPGWSVSKDSYTLGDLRRAAKALEAK